MKTIGVDLGGTNIKAALVDEQGEILKEKSVKTNLPRPAESVCDDIAALCKELVKGRQVAGIGVGCPGTVDGGMVLYSNNLDWKNFAMGDYLTAKTGLPVRIANDANATALIRMTKEAMDAHPESIMHQLAAHGVTGRTAFDAAEQGDAAAQAVTAQYIHYLAVGVANLINVFFPEVVGLSGGVANQGEALLAPLRAEVERLVFGHAFAQKKTRIAACTLGYRAGVIGAALLERD